MSADDLCRILAEASKCRVKYIEIPGALKATFAPGHFAVDGDEFTEEPLPDIGQGSSVAGGGGTEGEDATGVDFEMRETIRLAALLDSDPLAHEQEMIDQHMRSAPEAPVKEK